MLKLTLYGRPITKKNSSRIIQCKGHPMLLPSKQYSQYEKDCIRQIIGDKKQAINTAINLKCVYYMPTKHRVDLVNLLEGTCDILVKANVLEDDNVNIIKSHDGSRVLYDKDNPRVEIEIREIEI